MHLLRFRKLHSMPALPLEERVMVSWGMLYHFSAEEVETVEAAECIAGRYRLTVSLKSGRKLAADYQEKSTHDAMMTSICSQIDRERHRDFEAVRNALSIIKDTVTRIDRRQLRIWKQLSELLGVKLGEE